MNAVHKMSFYQSKINISLDYTLYVKIQYLKDGHGQNNPLNYFNLTKKNLKNLSLKIAASVIHQMTKQKCKNLR